MSPTIKILAFAGSARQASFNKTLVQIAAQGAREAGAEATFIDLADYPLPIFNQDLESAQGAPAEAQQLKKLFLEHDGLLIASPEYNSSLTALLKNTIDWVSRAAEGEAALAAYKGKVAGIMAASPGGLGGLRGLVHLRAILGNIGVTVVPSQMAVSRAFEAFDERGQLKESRQQQAILAIGRSVAEMARKLAAS